MVVDQQEFAILYNSLCMQYSVLVTVVCYNFVDYVIGLDL